MLKAPDRLADPPRVVETRLVSLKTLSELLDANRSSVRRWLRSADIHPVALGRGRNGAIRYRWRDVQEWIKSHAPVD